MILMTIMHFELQKKEGSEKSAEKQTNDDSNNKEDKKGEINEEKKVVVNNQAKVIDDLAQTDNLEKERLEAEKSK